jgi:hypothetical protein
MRSVTSTTAPISREALRLAREQNQLSQRELGRRVATRLGRKDATRALQMRLHRIETGDPISEEDRDLVDALAEELALGSGDLGVAPIYVWISTATGDVSFVTLAMRMLLFSSPEKAYDARDRLAILGMQGMQNDTLYPMHQAAINDVLEHNFGGSLSDQDRELTVAVDPDEHELLWLLVNQVAFTGGLLTPGGDDYAAVEDPREEAAQLALEHPPFESDLAGLHSLALRRLQHAPPAPHLRDLWKQEEEILISILDRIHDLRHEEREKALRQGPNT